ncbi:MAG: hypothetical protein JNM59_12385 [Hyphomonadaceae bacterium]|nr:hypothetical protein [Hyphomonadaceae bacterium]
MTWGVNEWVAAASAFLAFASLVLNWVVVRRQTELQFETLRAQMDGEVIAWVHEAIDSVAEAGALVRGRGVAYAPDEYRRRAHETAQKLSAIADRGRLFFPNESPHAHGQNKEAAFQGYRPPILDAVIFACGLLERLPHDAASPDEDAVTLLTKCRRLLVSEAQNAIDPRRRGQMLRRLATGRVDDKKSAFAIAAELGEAMEARYPGYLERRRDAAWVAEREAMSRRSR